MARPRLIIYVDDGICEVVNSDCPDIDVIRVDRDSDNPEEYEIAARLDVGDLTTEDHRFLDAFEHDDCRIVNDRDGRIVERS